MVPQIHHTKIPPEFNRLSAGGGKVTIRRQYWAGVGGAGHAGHRTCFWMNGDTPGGSPLTVLPHVTGPPTNQSPLIPSVSLRGCSQAGDSAGALPMSVSDRCNRTLRITSLSLVVAQLGVKAAASGVSVAH